MTESKSSKRPATYEDLCKVPEHMVAEIIDGELYAWPRPSLRHATATISLANHLGPFRQHQGERGGWLIFIEPEVHLGRDVLVPDLAGWRTTRMSSSEAAYATLAPDWVCEVLSPSMERIDREKKLVIYGREHVPHAWLIDPRTKTLEVLRLDAEKWIPQAMHSGHDRVRAVPFEAVEIELAYLWGETPVPRTTD